MTKEVTHTTVKVAEMIVENGQPVANPLPDETFIGNVSMDKAQKDLNKKYGKPVTVFQVLPETKTYEMPVEEFIKHASVKEEQTEADLPDQA